MPMPIYRLTSEVSPALTNGSGTPVVGKSPVATAILLSLIHI